MHHAGLCGVYGALVLAGAPRLAAPAPAADAAALAAPVADYRIEVRLDPGTKTLNGREQVTWRNVQDRPTSELRFHLYWNGWRNNRSTWMLEDRLRERSELRKRVEPEDWGYCEIGAARLLPAGDRPGAELTPLLRYTAPDDGNPEDRTVLVAPLPREVAPGESVELEIAWRARVPRTFARTGFRGDFFFLAQWFPKLGVYEPEGWNCHQYHAATEYYADFGTYEVRLTVPEGYVLGATGREVDREREPDGTVTYHYRQENVHDFAWTASPHYEVREARFEVAGLPPVAMRLLLQPEHRGQAERHFAATRAALEQYGRWFGPYPYGHLTIVDPAFESGAGGMEYPTLFTAGTRLFNPFRGGSPESVTIHEAGHQFWYGVVANNEFEHAWLDEGLNTFATARAYDAAYGDRLWMKRYFKPPKTDLEGFFPVLFADARLSRLIAGNRLDRFRPAAAADVPATPTFRYHPGTAARITYDKTALWLATLERYLGRETLQRILSTFFERWQFRHPRPEDFFAVAAEVAGGDLSWFFDQVHRGAARFDYAIESVASVPVRLAGYVERGGELALVEAGEGEPGLHRTEVVVRRRGDGVFPVDVVLAFEDGTELRRSWDGRSLWTLLVEERPAKLRHAVVDPERVLVLDLDYTNNSRLRDPEPALPVAKWASKWMLWLADYLGTVSFFG